MSIALMAAAWKVPVPATQKLVLLALCDWANDEGGRLYPSVARIAERICMSVRQTQRILHGLIEDGFLAVVENEFGGKPGQTRHYQINVDALTDTGDIRSRVSRVSPEGCRTRHPRGVSCVTRGMTNAAKRDDTLVTQTTIEPSIYPLEEPLGYPSDSNQPPAAKPAPVKTQAMGKGSAGDKPHGKPAEASDQPKGTRAPLACPADVDKQVWADWLELRKGKRAPVTETVLSSARREAQKLGWALTDFLAEWCLRGTQGLKADWLARNPQARPAEGLQPVAVSNAGAQTMANAQALKQRIFESEKAHAH